MKCFDSSFCKEISSTTTVRSIECSPCLLLWYIVMLILFIWNWLPQWSVFFFSRANFFNDSTNICLRKSSWDYSSQRRVYIILNVLLLIPVCLTDTDIYSKRNFQMKTIRNELNEFLSVEQFFSQARNNSRRKYQVKANHLVRIEQFSTECHRKSKTKVITTEKSEPRLTSSLTNENSK